MKIDKKCKYFEIQFMNEYGKNQNAFHVTQTHTRPDDDDTSASSVTNKFIIIG